MATKGRVVLRDIWNMLDECLPGWTKREVKHKIRVTHGGRTYPSLPTGEHGRRPGRAEIQKKQVRDLAEFFDILDCARKQLEILR